MSIKSKVNLLTQKVSVQKAKKKLLLGGDSNPQLSHFIAHQFHVLYQLIHAVITYEKSRILGIYIFSTSRTSRLARRTFFRFYYMNLRHFDYFWNTLNNFHETFRASPSCPKKEFEQKKFRFWPIFKTDFFRFYNFLVIFFINKSDWQYLINFLSQRTIDEVPFIHQKIMQPKVHLTKKFI